MFIELTAPNNKDPIYVNVANITTLTVGGSQRGTFIHLTSGNHVEVFEPIERIVSVANSK